MKKNILVTLLLLLGFLSYTHAHADDSLLMREDVNSFIQQMVEKHHFDAKQLKQWLGQAKIQPSILTAIAKPAEKLPWYKYQPIFLTDQRINEGVKFWQRYGSTLKKAENEYGIPPEIIIAIIGVESSYGKNTGQHKVLDALVTLGFEYPPRSKFFLSELEEFLLLAREEKWDPTLIKGSYAGAMGNPQFIASSYRRFSVDFNGNGTRDLINNVDDAIGSVANYFKQHGWQRGKPIVFPAAATGEKFKDLIASKANPEPTHALRDMTPLGIRLAAGAKIRQQDIADQTFALVSLEGKQGPEYWLGGKNFYVITRYNHSDQYAMAVYTLSEQIKKAYKNQLS